MKNSRKYLIWKYFYIMLACLFFSSCAFHYVSSPQYIPLNEKKGELKINQEVNSWQVGYSFADNYSIFSTGSVWSGSSFNLISSKENGGDYHEDGQGYEVNIGGSYFNKFKFLNYEFLAGGGIGNVNYENMRDLEINYKFNLETPKFDVFFQPDIGFKPNKNIELALCSRLSYHRFYDIHTTTTFGSNDKVETNDRYFDNKSGLDLFFWEPAFSLKLGTDKFKVVMLFAKTVNLNNKDIIYQQLYFNVGFLLNFCPATKE